MTDHELITELERRAAAREGDSIVPLLRAAAAAIRRLAGVKRSRSLPQHRRLFAIIKAAHKHWPSDHPFQPLTAEGLRDYLQVKAGWGKVHKIIVGDQELLWVEHKSIAFEKMHQNDFHALSEAICRLVHEIIGVDADILLEQDRMAA